MQARPAGAARALLAALLLVGLVAACSPTSEPAADPGGQVHSYRSAWMEIQGETARQEAPPGSLFHDFHQAAAAVTVAQARERWMGFLVSHRPEDGMYEDSIHARFVSWAERELERLELIASGQPEAAAELVERMKREDW